MDSKPRLRNDGVGGTEVRNCVFDFMEKALKHHPLKGELDADKIWDQIRGN